MISCTCARVLPMCVAVIKSEKYTVTLECIFFLSLFHYNSGYFIQISAKLSSASQREAQSLVLYLEQRGADVKHQGYGREDST